MKEEDMKDEDHDQRFTSFRDFMIHRRRRNNRIRQEWNDIRSMTYDTLLEVLEEMTPDKSSTSQQQEKE